MHPLKISEAAKVWAKIGFLSFGGPAGQVALMHKELVEKRKWIDESRFLHALNYCMLLPGPEAQQLATYIGWLLHKTTGGILAGVLFILPGFLANLLLSVLYVQSDQSLILTGLFFGLKSAVLAIVFEAVIRIGKRALKNKVHLLIAALAFILIFFLAVPFPFIVLGALSIGILGQKWFAVPSAQLSTAESDQETVIQKMQADGLLSHTNPSGKRAIGVLIFAVLLWIVPTVATSLFFGSSSVFAQEALFFSGASIVTFGGAYAVLSYVAQRAVNDFHWLTPNEMVDGLGLAETTPGPLILVVQFVAFLGAYRNSMSLDPLVAGCLGSLLTVWVTFVPSFCFVFLGGPFIERVRGNLWIQAALSSMTAAVVGVILNLSVWFGLHVLFQEIHSKTWGPIHLLTPSFTSLNRPALVLCVFSMLSIFTLKLGFAKTLVICGLAGIAFKMATQ